MPKKPSGFTAVWEIDAFPSLLLLLAPPPPSPPPSSPLILPSHIFLLSERKTCFLTWNMGINSLYCRTLIKSRPIRPLWASTFRTRTSTRSPGPRARLRRRWLTGSLSRVMLLLWMRPARPTPISTKAPNRAVLSTRPVSTAPTRRSLIDTMPRLKSACPKSEEKESIKKMNWLEGCEGERSLAKSGAAGSSCRCFRDEMGKGMQESKGAGQIWPNIFDFEQQPNTCACILPHCSASYSSPLSTWPVHERSFSFL